MPIRILKPTSPGRRKMSVQDFSDLAKKRPEKRLTKGKRRINGRGSNGRIAIRHRGGGHKRLWREIDFKQTAKAGIPGTITTLEYDPNRSARIALVHYADGDKRYVLAAQGLKAGDQIMSGERTKVKVGNRMQLKHIPVGYKVFNIELQPGRGGCFVRSAGTAATLVGLDGDHAILQMPSSEMRKVLSACSATIGTVSNPDRSLVRIGKAGRKRWLGIRPTVLGKSMNPVDHPHGGGEGHCSIGLKAPKTPWGKKALGIKTRRLHRQGGDLIIRRRTRKKKK